LAAGMRLIRSSDIAGELPQGHWGMTARTLAVCDVRLRVQLCEMAPYGGAEAHTHDEQDQIFLVIVGALRVSDGDGGQELRVAAGDAVLIGARTPHATRADAPGPTSYLVLTFPAESRPPWPQQEG
jgi:quercetin dioxygenase-like cupin family protein